MSMTEDSVMGSLPQGKADCFGQAVAGVLRSRYQFHTAKLVAQDLACTIKAAENILGGHLSAASITKLARAYGLGLLIDAGALVTSQTLETFIQQQAAEAEQAEARARERARDLHGLRSKLRASSGGDPGGSRPPP